MDVDDIDSWVSQPDACRCCLSASGTLDLTASYISDEGVKEVFCDMLQECYGISLSYLSECGPSRLVCAQCVGNLRDASDFKKQVLEADKRFQQYYSSEREGGEFLAMKMEPEQSNSSDGGVEQIDVPEKDSHTVRELPKPKLKLNKNVRKLKKKRDKHVIKEKNQEGSGSDSNTPISELAKTRQNDKNNGVDSDNRDAAGLDATESDASKSVKTRGTPRVTKECLTENRHLRSNITLILKNSMILPFRHINKIKYSCFYCDNSYLFFKELKTHSNEEHCNVTEKEILQRLKNPKSLIKAELSDIRCKICKSTFQTIDNLVEHLVKEHNKLYHDTPKFKPSHGILGFDLTSEKFKCNVCKKEFRFFKNLSVHMNEHSANFVCQFCGKKFLSHERLHAHVKKHKITNLKCLHCEEKFRSISARNYHVRKVHSLYSYKCPECDENFTQYQNRLQHLVDVHDLVKPDFKCDICEKEYANSSALRAHVRNFHIRNTEYPCPICGKSFGYKKSLKDHLLVHTGVKDFECKFCNKRFAKTNTLKVHMRIHLNEKPYTCPVCEAAFTQKSSLKNHVRVHHSDAGVDLNKL